MGRYPDFFIIGAAKAGTTALFEYLAQHPALFLSEPKEPHYFAFPGRRPDFRGPGDAETINARSVVDLAAYRALFDPAGGRLAGEASVSYLYYPEVAGRVREAVPGARLICLLRNPARRAFSAYNFLRSRVFEPEASFERALELEPERIADHWHHMWHYRAMGRYGPQLAAWLEAFPPEQLLILLYEDFRHDPQETLRACFRFLGVDERFVPPVVPSPHPSGSPRNRFLSRLLTRHHPLKSMLRRVLPARFKHLLRRAASRVSLRAARLDPALEARLLEEYSADVAAVERLLGRPIERWRSSPRASGGA